MNVEGWSRVHELFDDLHVLERHWAGTTTWGVGTLKGNAVAGLIEVGSGRFEGMIQVDGLAVVGFELRAQGEEEDRATTGTCSRALRWSCSRGAARPTRRAGDVPRRAHPAWKGDEAP